MKEFWNSKYAAAGFVYGEQPNVFYASELQKLAPGRLLLPGEGEGRNAAFAARLGWQVDAVDYSEVARVKALKLAQDRGLSLSDYTVADLRDYVPEKEAYDAIALVFVHLSPDVRPQFHQRLAESLKPGGLLIGEWFGLPQLKYSSGGPKDPALLYRPADLISDFTQLEIISLTEQLVMLHEGDHHKGQGAVVRLIAGKPKD